jgi:hypothetical protein
MPSYEISQTVNYSGVVSGYDTEEEALAYFVKNAHVEFYDSVESQDIEEIEEDDEDEDE